MGTDNLGPQFLYHGTVHDIEGQILPAKVHGGRSYWGDVGSERGEPAKEHAWTHPDESVAWDAAMDRVNNHYREGEEFAPRGRVYAAHPNAEQTPGSDKSMSGEVKSTHFDIAHQIDIMPGHQGTFPEINWNQHVKTSRPGGYLPGEEDANHPSNLSAQFGHQTGYMDYIHGDEKTAIGRLHETAEKEGIDRYIDRLDSRGQGEVRGPEGTQDDPLPGMGALKRGFRR
jgi:hypothetical protein